MRVSSTRARKIEFRLLFLPLFSAAEPPQHATRCQQQAARRHASSPPRDARDYRHLF